MDSCVPYDGHNCPSVSTYVSDVVASALAAPIAALAVATMYFQLSAD